MAVIQKIFSNYLFRVMSTWFAQYVQAKFQAAQPWLSIINVGTADNVAQINEAFEADPDAASLTVTQQWPGESEPSQHIVYPQIMYIGGL
jgi:hypothetical protein